jgi:hypothetical protein
MTNHNNVLTYKFNKKLMAEIESLKLELRTHFGVGKAPIYLIEALMHKQHAFEHGKAISRGLAIAKQQRELHKLNPIGV